MDGSTQFGKMTVVPTGSGVDVRSCKINVLLPTFLTLKTFIPRIRKDIGALPAAFSKVFQCRSDRSERPASAFASVFKRSPSFAFLFYLRVHVYSADSAEKNRPHSIIMAPLLERVMLSDLTEVPFIKIGDYRLEFELDPPGPELQEVAKKELRETPEIQKQSLSRLHELLKAEKDLKCPLDNEAWLIRFLRPCKYYPESSLELIKNYYNFKVKHASLYDNLKPSKEKNIFEQNILTVLPNRDQDGRRILIIELGKKWKHNKCNLDEVYKGCVLYLEAAMLEPSTQIAGAVVIFDMDGLTLQQAWQFTPPFAKRIVDLLQEAIPVRVKNIHVVNQPYVFNMVFALFKPFLKEKLKSRIIFHGTDRKSLHQYILPKCLPSQYGGTLEMKTINGPQWYSLLIQVDKEYEAISSYGYKKK